MLAMSGSAMAFLFLFGMGAARGSATGASVSLESAPPEINAPLESPDGKAPAGEQVVNSTLSARGYPNITVQAGVPVK